MKVSTKSQTRVQESNAIPTMPAEGFVRLEQVLRVYPVGKTTLYKEIAEGKFPPQIKLGRSAFWDVVQVRMFLKRAGATITVPE